MEVSPAARAGENLRKCLCELTQELGQAFSEDARSLKKALFHEVFNTSLDDSTGKRAKITGRDCANGTNGELTSGNDHRNRGHSESKTLAYDSYIGGDGSIILQREKSSGLGKGQHFIGDEQRFVYPTKLGEFSQEAERRNHDSGVPLNRL